MTSAERRLLENNDIEANWGCWLQLFDHVRAAVIATNDGPRSHETRHNT